MSYREVVFAFDTRLAPGPGWAPGWDEARQAEYLLVPVPWPLSVDERVWRRASSAEEGASGRPRFSSGAEALAARRPDEWAVAFTRWEGPGEPSGGDPLGEPEPTWDRLGYDVAEFEFPSGLTNCGYTPAERVALSARFGAALNRWHLFEDLPTAFACRDATARRVPEHAFSVVGLYRLGG